MSELSPSYPVWHPYTQMKGTTLINMVIGDGAYLYNDNGKSYLDGISSWWTNLHGHAHPFIAKAIYRQAMLLEQVIFAGFTHPPAVQLANLLLARIPFHQKVFYSDNGSTAVEVALKMALQYWSNLGLARTKIICFRDAYHGDTFGSMSISARGVFTQPYQPLLFEVAFIDTPNGGNDEAVIAQLEQHIRDTQAGVAAFIFEPLVLGSAGMLMYSENLLNRMIHICRQNQVLTIADEVMTGFGRTGRFLATDYCEHKPDIICLSKGITGGFMPFAATTCTQAIYDAFYSDKKANMLFHGHSYTANPLGCAAGIASLQLFETEQTLQRVARIEQRHRKFALTLKNHPKLKDLRQRGTILALELATTEASGYLNTISDQAYRFFLDRKIILRPLGNVIYILPPYCISDKDLKRIYGAVTEFLKEI
ncbi:MAG: adenosylmethionine--8-amino-7-oxononanoate transaminase [Chitinophagales bacterium]